MSPRTLLRIKPGHDSRVKSGHPWAYSNEIAMKPDYRALPPGGVVRLEADDGARLGAYAFHPHSLFAARIEAAAALRARLGMGAYCRLVHAEADGLPGLIVDRYGDAIAVQANTAAMDRLLPEIEAALVARFAPRLLVARNDADARAAEGLAQEVRVLRGEDASAVVEEGGVAFPVDLRAGQKTGFFFDQRANRDRVAALAPDARVLDVFCHTGAFGLRCAKAGAASVTLVDASAPALALAEAAAARNGLAVELRRGDAFDVLAALAAEGARFDIVICDPPAFIKRRQDHAAGLRGYGRMARLAAPLVAPGGFLFAASCSHHAGADEFAGQIAWGMHRARREGRIVWSGGAAPDHPVHPHLPESAYLKALTLVLD